MKPYLAEFAFVAALSATIWPLDLWRYGLVLVIFVGYGIYKNYYWTTDEI